MNSGGSSRVFSLLMLKLPNPGNSPPQDFLFLVITDGLVEAAESEFSVFCIEGIVKERGFSQKVPERPRGEDGILLASSGCIKGALAGAL